MENKEQSPIDKKITEESVETSTDEEVIDVNADTNSTVKVVKKISKPRKHRTVNKPETRRNQRKIVVEESPEISSDDDDEAIDLDQNNKIAGTKTSCSKMAATKKVSESQKEAESQIPVSNWLIAIGVGVTVTAAVVTTVYVVKSQRAKELKRLKYGQNNDDEESVQIYSNRFSRYWNLTVKTFTAVKSVVSDFFTSKKQVSPFVDANTHAPTTNLDDSIDSEE